MPKDRQFIGFDAYRKAMDCLRPGDVAILATPPAFRWVHFAYAIEKGLNVFMEKPITVDGPTHAEDAGAGRRIGAEEPQGGRRPDVPPLPGPQRAFRADPATAQIGDIIALRAYRMLGPMGFFASVPSRTGISELLYQIAAVPQLPLGQRRGLQRFLHPQHRRMLLDERRLAGPRPGHGRPRITAATRSIRTSTTTRSNTPSPTGRSCFSTAADMDGCHEEFASYAHGTKVRR